MRQHLLAALVASLCLGAGFGSVPALAIDYPDTDTAVGLIDDFRRELAA